MTDVSKAKVMFSGLSVSGTGPSAVTNTEEFSKTEIKMIRKRRYN